MPGYNHYTDCTCGWCDKSGFTFQKERWKRYSDEYSAKALLARNSAIKSYSACFVNPNAHCPVCYEPVFYYENRFGSRVFFDELGQPWPKHGCTDNAPPPRDWRSRTPAPMVRTAGLIAELVEAASVVGRYEGERILTNGLSLEWTLLEIVEVTRTGFRNRVVGRYISRRAEHRIYLAFDSSGPRVFKGDVVSIRLRKMSIWDQRKQGPRYYKLTLYRNEEFKIEI